MTKIITKPDIAIDQSLLDKMKTAVHEQGQVIIHCIYKSAQGNDGIRIWPSTYLFDHHSDHVSQLAHAENITLFPNWTWVGPGDNYFTLIFSGLPKSCSMFDLIEDCNGGSGAFRILNIQRNREDVYYAQI